MVLEASRSWHEQIGAARVVISRLEAPDGQALPYLFFVEQLDADGKRLRHGRSLVVGSTLARGGGADAATAYLTDLGFPAKPIHPGLLLELLDIFAAVPVSWLVLPSFHGWQALDAPDDAIGRPPVELEYAGAGAALRLFRAASSGDSGGDMPSAIERLTVTFDAAARISLNAERQGPGGDWRPIPVNQP